MTRVARVGVACTGSVLTDSLATERSRAFVTANSRNGRVCARTFVGSTFEPNPGLKRLCPVCMRASRSPVPFGVSVRVLLVTLVAPSLPFPWDVQGCARGDVCL